MQNQCIIAVGNAFSIQLHPKLRSTTSSKGPMDSQSPQRAVTKIADINLLHSLKQCLLLQLVIATTKISQERLRRIDKRHSKHLRVWSQRRLRGKGSFRKSDKRHSKQGRVWSQRREASLEVIKDTASKSREILDGSSSSSYVNW